jgi:hypothetical protein
MEINNVLLQAWMDYNPDIVKINENTLENLIFTENQKNTLFLTNNDNDFFKNKTPKEIILFLIALNSNNYQFWDIVDNNFIRYENNGKIGALAYNDGFLNLYNELEKQEFKTNLITAELIYKFFKDIPEKEKRVQIFKESFNLENNQKIFNLFINHIKDNPFNTELAEKIAEILPLSFQDNYLKKIQLALYNISDALTHKGYCINCDITVAADYQIPKVLEAMGILTYSNELTKKIDNLEIIEENSAEERALRAATVLACDDISKKNNISIPELDKLLWLSRNNFKNKKFHLTKTSNY